MKVDASSKVLEWEWRNYFTAENLRLAEKDLRSNKLLSFEMGEDGRSATGKTVSGFTVAVHDIPLSYEELKRYPRWDNLLNYDKGNARHFSHFYSCNCGQGRHGARCRHLANLLLRWEQTRGPFVIPETEAERKARLEDIRREKEIELKKKKILRAEECFAPLGDESMLCFKPDKILASSDYETNQYDFERMKALLSTPTEIEVETVFTEQRTQNLRASGTFEEKSVSIQIDRRAINSLYCSCGKSSMYQQWGYNALRGKRMCCHALALWALFRRRIAEENPGDETDAKAIRLLELMTDAGVTDEPETAPAFASRKPCVTLAPRILPERSDGDIRIGFDIGLAGQRLYALRSFDNLCREAENGGVYKLTPKQTLSFSECDFTEEAMKWYNLIQASVSATERINRRLQNSYHYYGNGLATGDSLPLDGRALDEFYDMVEGSELLCQYGGRNETRLVRVRRTHPRAHVRLEPMVQKGRIMGICLSGDMPRLMRGADYSYSLDDNTFGRVDTRELQTLRPLQAISDAQGRFSCVIGERKYAEFYHRVLPALLNAEQVELEDAVGDALNGRVPPEPEFTFYIDMDDAAISCKTEVRYDGVTVEKADLKASQRDFDQEARVDRAVAERFPHRRDDDKGLRWVEYSEDALVNLLTEGVAALAGFGEVRGSDAFNRVRMVPAPQPRLSLRVEGGLLDLSIRTKDISPEELLELLDSYRRRRRWHRLRSGDFVDLSHAEALDELNEAVEAMDVPLEKLVREGASVPKYRALYVDRLLEAHEALAASRDKQYKALIRSFQTIRDSDFELPAGLSDVLRPYQLYGFRWLSTLAQSGFGGILADEMGLGKTLQLLAFVQSQRDAGETRPSLVVCPASLVYNWREECRRFTPDIPVQTLDGTLSQRKKLFRAMGEAQRATLYITSYDLLKRDITLYDGLEFATVALDEAQYIKNQRAAVSRAVRVLKAEHRFALTGTPIENRLSELWSIFDFLMPGFLYSAAEFSTRFEGPVMKQKDPAATARLSRMTEPFILRRKKADVLRDLPEKLEETRSFAMEPDQRKLYDAQVVRMRQMLAGAEDFAAEKLRILAEITRLRQLCCDPSLLFEDYAGSSAKRTACVELIQNAIDAGHRMLVFSQFTSMLELLAADLRREGIEFYTITGATSKQERFRLVNDFNAGEVPVFLISLKAGGTGLNLTGADVVIHYDPWWNLAVQNQATDRAHRIGQTRQVTVIRLIAAETIEEKIVELQEAKRELAESIISGEGGSLMSLSREELLELLG